MKSGSVAHQYGWITSSESVGSCLKAKTFNTFSAQPSTAPSVAVGDTKYLRFEMGPADAEPIIVISGAQWDRFLSTVRLLGPHATDPAETGLVVELGADGDMTLTSVEDDTTLWFNSEEVAAFVLGVRQGELTTDALVKAGAGSAS